MLFVLNHKKRHNEKFLVWILL